MKEFNNIKTMEDFFKKNKKYKKDFAINKTIFSFQGSSCDIYTQRIYTSEDGYILELNEGQVPDPLEFFIYITNSREEKQKIEDIKKHEFEN